jgi:myo-inositol 2-dehydrogenase/D-chiro-inositol 1-dehydrogenase
MKIGLIGAGRIGQVHASTIVTHVPQAQIVAVADVVEVAAKNVAEKYRIPNATTDYTQLLNDSSIDAILICSPTDRHAKQIIECAQAGKHIFCEKPIAMTLPEIDRALEAVKKARVKLQIGFNRRFDSNFRRVRHAIVNGEIGEPHMLHIISRDPAPPPLEYIKNSGGIFLDMAIHDFDMARYLIGDEVVSVYVQADVKVDPRIGEAGDVDTAVTMLRFKNGVIGTIDNSRKAVYGYDQRVEVFGSGGAINIGNNFSNSAIVSNADSVRRDLPLNFFMQRYVEAYATEIIEFIDAIDNNKSVPCDGFDAREATRLGLAAKKSLAENRPVELSEIR